MNGILLAVFLGKIESYTYSKTSHLHVLSCANFGCFGRNLRNETRYHLLATAVNPFLPASRFCRLFNNFCIFTIVLPEPPYRCNAYLSPLIPTPLPWCRGISTNSRSFPGSMSIVPLSYRGPVAFQVCVCVSLFLSLSLSLIYGDTSLSAALLSRASDTLSYIVR